jgi:hypothetical protein
MTEARDSIRQVQTQLWYVWAEIAIDHEHQAWVARGRELDALNDGAVLEIGLEQEVRAALVAVTASTHAIDAYYTAVADARRELKLASIAKGPGRREQILAVLAITFGVSGNTRNRWQKELAAVYGMRNSAAHYRAEWGALVDHPIGIGTTPVAARYTAEGAQRSVDLALDIIAVTIESTASRPPAPAFRTAWRHSPSDLKGRRLELASERHP